MTVYSQCAQGKKPENFYILHKFSIPFISKLLSHLSYLLTYLFHPFLFTYPFPPLLFTYITYLHTQTLLIGLYDFVAPLVLISRIFHRKANLFGYILEIQNSFILLKVLSRRRVLIKNVKDFNLMHCAILLSFTYRHSVLPWPQYVPYLSISTISFSPCFKQTYPS